MAKFTTKLSLGSKAFGVSQVIDPTIQTLTVGQIRVTETKPSTRVLDPDPCYLEEYMCIETGVGSGTIWRYGTNIFATSEEAEAGVIAAKQRAYKQRAARDAENAAIEAKRLEMEKTEFARLKAKFESTSS